MKKPKYKYTGTEYSIFLKDTRKGKGEITSMKFFEKNEREAKKEARKTYKPFMKITKIKKGTKWYREV